MIGLILFTLKSVAVIVSLYILNKLININSIRITIVDT